MIDYLPKGTFGTIKIEDFTISKADAEINNMRALMRRDPHGYVREGEYTRLVVGSVLMMSDTPMEMRTAVEYPARYARGHVLMAGLGMGMSAKAILDRDPANRVTVVEINEDVCAQVGGALLALYGADRLCVVHTDFLEFRPKRGETFDAAWFDIWPTICGDNLDEIATFNRRYARRVGWKGSWMEDWLKAERRADARRRW